MNPEFKQSFTGGKTCICCDGKSLYICDNCTKEILYYSKQNIEHLSLARMIDLCLLLRKMGIIFNLTFIFLSYLI